VKETQPILPRLETSLPGEISSVMPSSPVVAQRHLVEEPPTPTSQILSVVPLVVPLVVPPPLPLVVPPPLPLVVPPPLPLVVPPPLPLVVPHLSPHTLEYRLLMLVILYTTTPTLYTETYGQYDLYNGVRQINLALWFTSAMPGLHEDDNRLMPVGYATHCPCRFTSPPLSPCRSTAPPLSPLLPHTTRTMTHSTLSSGQSVTQSARTPSNPISRLHSLRKHCWGFLKRTSRFFSTVAIYCMGISTSLLHVTPFFQFHYLFSKLCRSELSSSGKGAMVTTMS
jgi:hypothetical protein